MASSFTKPTLLLSSTCVFHVFFGHPRFLLPFTSNSNVFLKTCPSSLLNTCPYLTPFAFAIWTTFYFNPNISIRSSRNFLCDTKFNWILIYFKTVLFVLCVFQPIKAPGKGAGPYGDYRSCDTPLKTLENMLGHINKTFADKVTWN